LSRAVSCPFLNERRKSIEYRIPAGYRGWVRIEYANPKCISSRRDEKSVLEISEAGVACTSDDYESGEAVDRYKFIDARGNSVASSSAAAVRNGRFTRCSDASGSNTKASLLGRRRKSALSRRLIPVPALLIGLESALGRTHRLRLPTSVERGQYLVNERRLTMMPRLLTGRITNAEGMSMTTTRRVAWWSGGRFDRRGVGACPRFLVSRLPQVS
jgi:Family of unknown function (DUF6843)